MRLVTFEVQTVLGRFQRLGLWKSPFILDLNAAYAWLLDERGEAKPQHLADVLLPSTMRGLIESGNRGLYAAREVEGYFEERIAGFTRHQSNTPLASSLFPLGLQDATLVFNESEVTLKTPLPNPNMLRDFLAFEVHTKSGFDRRGQPMPEAWYKMPVYYKGNPNTLIGPNEPICWPAYSEKFDYELELACILGKAGKDIPVTEASSYIFGYAIMNDFSARAIQMEEMTCRLGPAKGKDFGTAIGPCIVTADEVKNPRDLKMSAKINGEIWSEGNSGTSHWTFEQMIAHVSMEETIYPSDILGSGTVGRGCGLELDRWLQPGDTVELEIESLGLLRNQVVTHAMQQKPLQSLSSKS
jgi:2-keto-4-pentenoate hydratase/2-oxohepta-3-ene-1,7-dioic acid hydratase in catechol pathway